MTLYQRYARLPIRFADLGLERGSEKSSYFCTPRGSRVIGWAGVDGIHFCFVPGYGDMVFAVNPMSSGDYVQAVGRSFADFLRLVLACGGSAAIEQARNWTRQQFDLFLEEGDPAYPPRTEALRVLGETLGLSAMPDPYGYLAQLRGEFDCAALQPREAAAAPVSERAPFPVVWNSGLHGRPRLRREAKAVSCGASFRWGEESWYVPYLYVCAEGIMVDFCIGVEMARVEAFLQQYAQLTQGDWGMELPQEQQDELERINPLHVSFRPALQVDGRELRAKGGSSTCWVPESCSCKELREDNGAGQFIVEHYDLDRQKAWVFWRCRFAWAGRRGTKVQRVTLHLTRDKDPVTVGRFTDPCAGDRLAFACPGSGQAHLLTMTEVERQVMDTGIFRDPDTEYPAHYVALCGFVEPPLEDVTLRDCAEGDRPRSKNGSAAFAIQLFVRRDKVKQETGKEQVWGASSFYFDAPQSLTWRIIVNQKPLEDVEIQLK